MHARRKDGAIWLHRGISSLVLLGLLGFSIVAVLSGVTRKYRPDVALSVRPNDAIARAQLANFLQRGSVASTPEAVEELTRQTLLRDPTSGVAARVLGEQRAQVGEQLNAATLMNYSDALSRRDLRTQMWLIEYHVRREDIPAVLRHFHAAASTSRGATTLLFPMLATALNDPRLIEPLAESLAHEPWWDDSLLMTIAQQTPSVSNVGHLFLRLAQDGHPPRADITAIAVSRLRKAGQREDAMRLDRLASEVGTSARPKTARES